jgi:hypothetical protein
MKEFKYFNPKNVYDALGNMSRKIIPDPEIFFLPSRIHGSEKAPDQDLPDKFFLSEIREGTGKQ